MTVVDFCRLALVLIRRVRGGGLVTLAPVCNSALIGPLCVCVRVINDMYVLLAFFAGKVPRSHG